MSGDGRGAGTILYVEGPTNQNKYCGKSVGENTKEVPLYIKM